MPAITATVDAPAGETDVLSSAPAATTMQGREPEQRRCGISLFWRTFFLLAVLLAGSALGWYQLFRTLEYEPRILDSARQVASLVNLSRAALANTDAISRVSVMKALSEQESLRILPREPGDLYELFSKTELERRVTRALVARIGPQTVVARQVNGEPGLWVGFMIEGDSYWLLMDRAHVDALLTGSTWVLWLAVLAVLSLIGAAALAQLINHPLRQLSIAASHVRNGDYAMARLDERARSKEIREVNIGFNRMAEQLAKIELERTEMLAGISHDLRTPLARLRLESELSTPDAEARNNMIADINQVDAIISKFMDYARPDQVQLEALPLSEVVASCVRPFLSYADMDVKARIGNDLWVQADEIELSRVLSNLLENARRYGASPEDGVVRVRIAAARLRDKGVELRVSDHGPGVSAAQMEQLTRPFYRGDVARTSATGAGLGLAIVAKMVENMGGCLGFTKTPGQGLTAIIRLPRAVAPLEKSKRGRRTRAF